MYVSDSIDLKLLDKTKFNIISSGTGTGKTYFIANNLHKQLDGIENSDILFVASRSLIVDQQSKNQYITKFNKYDDEIIDYWNGKRDRSLRLHKQGIQIMTYDKLVEILIKKNQIGLETLSKIKIIVFDECHTLFSDTFIKNIEVIKIWIRDNLYSGNKIIIGMTATPNIIKYYQEDWGVDVNPLNEELIIKYRAKQLHCTNFETIPYLVATQLKNRTMIMCYSYSDCLKLKEQIPDSFVMISKSNSEFTKEMKTVRDYIITNEVVPETYIDEDGEEKKLNVLITTSTMREGINLRDDGTLKNIICCFSDELHITQFAGRARYNLDNLIVADTYIPSDNVGNNKYLSKCRQLYRDFLQGNDTTSWFDSIEQLVEGDIAKVKIFMLSRDENRFIEYINKKWLVPEGEKNISKYRIYKEEDKNEIVSMAIECRLLKLYQYQINFNKIVKFMQNVLGYTIEDRKTNMNNLSTRYKLIVDFDEFKVDKNYRATGEWKHAK